MFSQNLNFTNINADMGLPSNECYRIAQDANGYIWIATESGLVKYNSRDFIFFNTAKGMPSNAVYALDADTSGRVWFATGNWQVGYIFNDSIHVLRDINFYNKETQNGDVIYKIKYNEHTNSLLVSSHHQTVEIKDNNGKYFSKATNVSAVSKDYVFIKNNEGLYIANQFNNKRSPEKIYKYSTNAVYSYFSQNDSLLLPVGQLSTFFSEAFSVSDKEGNTTLAILNYLFIISKERRIIKSRKLPSQIQTIHLDKQNNIWVGCKKEGVFLFKDGDINQEPQRELLTFSASSIAEDMEGGIWITTLEKGVFYCLNKFAKVDIDEFTINNGINFSKVVNGKLFLSNDFIALAKIEKDTIFLNQFPNEPKAIITDVIEVTNGYIITTLLGIYRTDRNLKNIYRYLSPSKTYTGAIGTIAGADEPILTFVNLGIFYINGLSLKFSYDGPEKIKHAIFTKDKQLITLGKSGLSLIQSDSLYKISNTINEPLNKLIEREFSRNDITLRLHKFPIQTPAAQSAHDVNKLYEDTYGNIWLPASSDTLNILDKTFNLKKQILISEKNINCRNVLQINATSFFVCSNKGLIQISFKDSSFKKYQLRYFNKTNGLPSSDIYNIVFFKNNYYVNTSKGLCFFAEPSLLQHSSFPNTVISSFAVNDSIQTINTNNAFSYKQNNITFQVDALTYKKITQKGFFFKYKLEGFDENFKLATSNIITYNNLPPGNYKFIAKAFYDNDTEDQTPAELSFTIKPTFWQTWWGILFLFCVGVFIVLLFVQWRIKKVKEQEAKKNEINKTIAEYRFTALKAQMDPHFVFNSINVIQNLILEKDKSEAYNSLGKFSRLIRSILNQSDSVFATIEEEISLIDLFVELNQLRVEHSFTFKKEIQQNTLSCLIPSLIIQPFIENALWHGILPNKGEKKGEIILRVFSNQKDILTIEIQDNGVGRKASTVKKPASVIYKSKGINLIKERLNAYKSINKNCLAELDIVDLEENEIPLGTLVKLKISVADEKE